MDSYVLNKRAKIGAKIHAFLRNCGFRIEEFYFWRTLYVESITFIFLLYSDFATNEYFFTFLFFLFK